MIAAPTLICTGCGRVVGVDGGLPTACPGAGDGRDHVLGRAAPADAGPPDDDPHPFIRYRAQLFGWRLAMARGLTDADYVALVRALDAAVAAVDGRGFAVTPYRAAPALAAPLGLADGAVSVKDETGNVASSHKARHLFGLALDLAIAARVGAGGDDARPLAIASCGNAALAAAVVARAVGRPLTVFVPPTADAAVLDRLVALRATLAPCPRTAGDPPGDPCHHRFRAAVAAGALPFSCQGPDNGLTIDGGLTLGFELAEHLAAAPVDHLFVQVGGGALASAIIQGLTWAAARGALPRLPQLHAVQTAGGFPLVRAWRRVARTLGAAPGPDLAVDADAARADADAAAVLREHADAHAIDRAVAAAAADRAGFMTPWPTEPVSAASGILDDETYDWLAIVRGMLTTGAQPVIAAEADVLAAHRLGAAAGIRASATGTAGLAGALTLAGAELLDGRVAVLFTGVDR